jgi:cytoskeletal protein RodZ
MRGKAMLIAAVVVLFVGGAGAAAWVAANDKDHPSRDLLSSSPSSQAPSEAAPTPDPAPATPPDATPPDATTTEAQPTTTAPAPPSSEPATAPKRKTHFKREKRKPNNAAPKREFAVPPAREFSGEGNARLGTVDVKATSVLKWKTKGHFEVRFGREDFPVIAPTKSGQLVLPPFRFEQVRVIAAGRWKITISPQ